MIEQLDRPIQEQEAGRVLGLQAPFLRRIDRPEGPFGLQQLCPWLGLQRR